MLKRQVQYIYYKPADPQLYILQATKKILINFFWVGTPKAEMKNSWRVQQHQKTSQNDDDDNCDSATVNGNELYG